jgi:predicted dehydrogenase
VAAARSGKFGKLTLSKGYCHKPRWSIGNEPIKVPPKGLDFNLWLGPAAEQPYHDNLVHYDWHWFWDFGNGDIGNQGVHQMDIARWGLDVTMPSRVTSMSGMYLFDDDKEVPNVILSAFDFPEAGEKGRMMVFDTRPWMTNDEKNAKVGVLFYGSEGYMVIDSYSHYKCYMGKDEEPGDERNAGGDHYANFIDAVRKEDSSILHAEIEEGHYSAALCHLGLTSARLGRSLVFDPKKEDYVGDTEASTTISREYRAPFVVA